MYTLYFDKSKGVLKIEKAKKIFLTLDFTDEVKQYNNYYFYCLKRKPLTEKAIGIKEDWIAEAKAVLEKYESIEIK